MTAPHPDAEFPFTFYFNGVAMPKWSQCWYATNLDELAKPIIEEWGGVLFYDDFLRLRNEMDDSGSEDPARYQALMLLLLNLVLTHESSVLASLTDFAAYYPSATPTVILEGIREGLFQTIARVTEDNLAFWATGSEENRLHLVECIRRHRLPPSDPDYIEAPHIIRLRFQAMDCARAQHKQLLRLAQGKKLPAPLRVRINHFPPPLRPPHNPK